MDPLFLCLEAAADAVALSPETMQRMVREGEFPPPRQLSSRRVGWLTSELREWSEKRPVSQLLPPPNTSRRGASASQS